MQLRRVLVVPVVVLLTSVVLGCSSDEGSSEDTTAVQLSAAAQEGKAVAQEQGCNSCHRASGDGGIGPSWEGLAGSEVELEDGTTVVADEEYLTRSILEPNAQIVKGYNGIMPERALDEDQVAAIVAYLQEIGVPQ